MTSQSRTAPPVGRWAAGLVAVAVVLFSVGLWDGLHCRLSGCAGTTADRLLGLDTINGVPRLFTTGMFVAFAVVAGTGAWRAGGRPRLWWTATVLLGVTLAVMKLTSVHSKAKADSALLTVLVGLALAALGLTLLWSAARRWGIAAGTPLVIALAVYAFAALGLDVLTGLVADVPGRAGAVLDSLATYVEELGEALSAVWVLVTASRWRPPAGRSVRQQ